MANDIAIKVDNVSKTFKLPHEKNNSIKGAIVSFHKKRKGYEKQQVLTDVSFEIKKGEFFGIVGRNGSGKSTLLKLLAGIYSPDSGSIDVRGKLTPFIELGVGFNPELSGRENVYLNGALLGFDRAEMDKMYEDIVEFAELERFMDQKLKNYSSGMQVRLAFSIAIRAKSDILLIDEVLAVGDESFQRKCFEYFDQLKRESRTVVFVTHDMSSFEKYCDSGILVDSGKIVYNGEPRLISVEYKAINLSKSKKSANKNTELTFDDSIQKASVNGKKRAIFETKDTIELNVSIIPKKDSSNAAAGISILTSEGTYVAFHNTRKELALNLKAGVSTELQYSFNAGQLMPGSYVIDIALYDKNESYIDLKSHIVNFIVDQKDIDLTRAGLLNLQGKWTNND